MKKNMPGVVPMIDYESAENAIEWLSRAFGFEERFRIAGRDCRLVKLYTGVFVKKYRRSAVSRKTHPPGWVCRVKAHRCHVYTATKKQFNQTVVDEKI